MAVYVGYQSPQFRTTTLNVPGGIDASQTTGITLTSIPSDLDITKPGIICVDYANPLVTTTAEFITYTSINGSNVLQGATRAAEGYAGKAHNDQVVVAWIVSKSHVNQTADALTGVTTAVSLNTATLTSPVINTGVSGTAIDTDGTLAANSDTIVASQKATKTYVDTMTTEDGWTPATGTWTYASASTITVPSGAASLYQKGDRIKWTQTTVKYGVIVAVADTLLTIAVNTDYVVANAAITLNYYSHQLSPLGYPTWFTCTLSPTGLTSISELSLFSIIGNSCTIMTNISGTSNATTFDITLPVAAINAIGSFNIPIVLIMDNSAWKSVVGIIGIAVGGAASATAKFGIDGTTSAANAYGGFTASGSKSAYCEFTVKF